MIDTQKHPLLLFDGVCNLCNGFIQFIIKRDPEATFRFAPLQSEAGAIYREEIGEQPTDDMDTVILVENNRVYTHSDVALRVVRRLGGLWPVLGVFGVIPKGMRDAIYNWVARNRYRWFGKKASCMIPTPEVKERFL